MSAPEDLRKIRELLETLSLRKHPFLERCAQTKALAVTDFEGAISAYKTLANQAIFDHAFQSKIPRDSIKSIEEVEKYLNQDNIGESLLDALKTLKKDYLDTVLRPAVKIYFHQGSNSYPDLEVLYENAFNIDGLIELVQFLERIRKDSS